MSEEELYKLALSDIHKYNLLNEIFAIRDKRFLKEQQESMLCVNGYIGIDTLNDYVNLINQLEQKENIIKEVREYIKNLTNFQIGYGLNENDIKRTMYASENNFVKELLEILDKGE